MRSTRGARTIIYGVVVSISLFDARYREKSLLDTKESLRSRRSVPLLRPRRPAEFGDESRAGCFGYFEYVLSSSRFCTRFVKYDQPIGVCFVGLNYKDSYMRRIGELRVGIASQISKAS